MPLYQLSIPSSEGRSVVPFVYFSNGSADPQVTVVVTHRRLPPAEAQRWAEKIVAFSGSEAALGRRAPDVVEGGGFNGDYRGLNLEYMRHCLVWRGGKLLHAVCMDTLCDLAAPQEATLARGEGGPLAAAATAGGGMVSTVPASAHQRATRSRTLKVPTTTHGTLSVVLSVFADPDTRNGISIRPGRRVTLDTAWGAAVRAVNPRRFILRRFVNRAPPPLPAGCATAAEANDSDYFVAARGHFTTDPSQPATMLVPRGGGGRSFRLSLD